MSYLFSFEGRINRAKIWLFILVSIGWEIVIGLVAAFGLRWTNYFHNVRTFAATRPPVGHAPIPWPDPLSGTGYVAAGIILLLLLLYVIAYLAIYTKRLHDRDKSAWWLLLYFVTPWLLNIFVWTSRAHAFRAGLERFNFWRKHIRHFRGSWCIRQE
jgi:uncharacterized membrane protein YhaH (DUF805 family)